MCEKLCIDTIDTIDTKSIYAYFSTHVDTHGMDTQMESSHMQWIHRWIVHTCNGIHKWIVHTCNGYTKSWL